MSELDVSDLDPYVLIQALHASTKPVGFGFLEDNGDLTIEQVKELVGDIDPTGRVIVDYLQGRPIKIRIKNGKTHFFLYNRDAGEGVGEHVLQILRSQK